jgi:predicted metal-binding membrane protein
MVWGLLLAGSAVAWTVTIRIARDMGNGPGTMGVGLAGFIPVWVAMMTAMMWPAVAPVGSMYLRGVRMQSPGWLRALGVGTFIAGHLAVWTAFGVLAFGAVLGSGRLAHEAPRAALWVGAATFALAGLYQLTPLKDRCLEHCRSPLGLLMHFGAPGRLRDLRAGLAHGGFCLGGCWALMVVLIAVGIMNVAWMAGLAAVIFLEKTWRYGRPLGIVVGAGLIVLALLVPTHPGLVPGLQMNMTGMSP